MCFSQWRLGILIPPPTDVAVAASTLSRVVIEAVEPEIDAGRFPIKRILGDAVIVQADIFADGHEVLAADLLYRTSSETAWQETPMRFVDNDRWQGSFHVTKLEPYFYTIQAWVDAFQTWARDFLKKYEAGQDVSVDLLDRRRSGESRRRPGSRPGCPEIGGLCGGVPAAFFIEGSSVGSAHPQRGSRRSHGVLSGSRRGHQPSAGASRRRRPREGALQQLVRNVSALLHRATRPNMALSAIASDGSTTWRRWDLTSSIFRPFIPSELPAARARTIAFPPVRKIREVRGRSDRRRAGTNPSIPQLGTLEDFKSCNRRRGARPGDGPGHCLSMLPRSSLCARA